MNSVKINKILNPRTNRFVHVGTQKYHRLVSEGVIQPIDDLPVSNEPSISKSPTYIADTEFKTKLIDVATDVAKSNIGQFIPELTQEQTDRLLKKLLYEKLCLNEKPKTKKSKPKPKKKKFKIVQPSESESESDSD